MKLTEYEWRQKEVEHARLRDVILPGLTGAATGSVLGVYLSIAEWLIIGGSFVTVLLLFRAIAGGYRTTTVLVVFILLFCSGIINGKMHASESDCARTEPSVYREGVVVDDPEGGKFTAQIDGLCGDVQVRSSSVNLEYGDHVSFTSRLELPEDFRNQNGTTVRYRDLMRARGVGYVAKAFDVKKLDSSTSIVGRLFEIKSWFKTRFSKIPEPESGLLAGMLLGGSSDLPKDIQQDFITSSLIHIVVLSGANLAFVAGGALVLCRRFFGFRLGVALASIISILYALMGGMGSATLRALFMVLLVFLGKFLFREAHGGRILLVSACVLTILNPYLPRDDPSFQLSVLALLGLIYFAPLIDRKLPENLKEELREYIAGIFGAQLAVLPLIVHMSGVFAPWGFIANFLVLWILVAVPYLALVLFTPVNALVISILSLPLVLVLRYALAIAHGVSRLPFAQIHLALNMIAMVTIYIILFVWTWSKYRRVDMRPLQLFTEKENSRLFKAGRIPWVE